jgi:MFS family permease
MGRITSSLFSGAMFAPDGMGAPLRHGLFRRVWIASLASNLGLMIQSVGAAWAMTMLTSAADKVALVQTAIMLPILIFSVAAGALADMYDRRKIGLSALGIAIFGASILSGMSIAGLLTPNTLLACCFIVGCGMALFGPAWQASVGEQVPTEILPSAIALNSISFNIARSFGPALGGIIVAAAGASAAFVMNAVLYIPLAVVLFRWNRISEPARLPPERLTRAIVSGVRYVMHSPAIRIVLTRTLLTGAAGSSLSALMPLVAKDRLHGGAEMFGVMLGAYGVGAVIGAVNIAGLRRRFGGETLVRAASAGLAVATAIVGLSHWPILTALALAVAGGSMMIAITLFNIGVQLSAPRWVAGRALAAFQAAVSGGVALGSWGWGEVADAHGVETALLMSAGVMAIAPLVGLWLRMPAVSGRNDEGEMLADPEVNLALTGRSGPIVIEAEYRVDPARARAFHNVMQAVQLSRQRNGAYGWSLARDIADIELWTERFHCPTWLDYLRQRNRPTEAERSLHDEAYGFHIGPEDVRIRRMLERPFGSVRWNDEAPDRAVTEVLPLTTPNSGG